MPTNLPAEWYKYKEEYDNASGKEKIRKLEKLISVTPSHKGCENLRAQLKTKLAKLKEKEGKKKKDRKSFSISKEGDAQVSIIGLPNCGKSTFLKRITDAKPKIADYPYTTTKPEVCMFEYKGVKIQMVEIPSTFTKEFLSIARTSELVIFLIGETLDENIQRKELIEMFEKDFKKYIFVRTDISKKDLFKKIWSELGLIRVYTKEPRKDIGKPMILEKGSTVEDICKDLHKDFFRYFKFAKISGPSAKFDGERIGLEHELKDEDIVEIHIKK